MDFLNSPYQLAMLFGLFIWMMPMLQFWVRFDGMPHASELLICIMLMPLVMLDEILMSFGLAETLPFVLGVFRFVPLLIVILMYIGIHKMVYEKPVPNKELHYLLAAIFFCAQIPFLMLPNSEKLVLAEMSIVGQVTTYWPVYLFYLLSSLVMLAYALKMEELLREYNSHLGEQVVDIDHYEMTGTGKIFGGLITVSFGSIILVIAVAPGLIPLGFWQSIIALLQFCIIYILILVLLQKRKYSPSPIDYGRRRNKYTEDQMRIFIAKAEHAVLSHKTYKHIGLRLRELADLANIEPEELVSATKIMLNRNFRAYMYHYRLQYARKIIMRSDIKLSVIARKLGFDSEKELSEMFVKYIQTPPEEEPDIEIPEHPVES